MKKLMAVIFITIFCLSGCGSKTTVSQIIYELDINDAQSIWYQPHFDVKAVEDLGIEIIRYNKLDYIQFYYKGYLIFVDFDEPMKFKIWEN